MRKFIYGCLPVAYLWIASYIAHVFVSQEDWYAFPTAITMVAGFVCIMWIVIEELMGD
jgi:hypothetical protein